MWYKAAMIEAAIFDMDGLLIDSEPLWAASEIEIFATVGVMLSQADCRQTVGTSLDDVVALRHRQKPWKSPSQAEISFGIHRRVVELVRERGRALPGAVEAVAFARSQGVKVALATASDPELVEAALGVMGLQDAFDTVQSASSLPFGKPHPQVYLNAAKALGADPQRSVAFEDTVVGLIAAKAARMICVAVPDERNASDPRYTIADAQLSSLESLNQELWQHLTSQIIG